MQTYLGKGPEQLVNEALATEPDLLLLDEPCLNMNAPDAKRLLNHVSAWLDAHPNTTAICIAHRADHVPSGFEHMMDLDAL
jgi:ABC-type molybdenum transport system ATPase subunit/photorepair protein PhrA